MEHEIFRFAEMILRDRCSISYDLAALFCGRRSTLDRKIAKRIGTRLSALRSTFHFWGSCGSASCLMLSTSKNEDRRIGSFLTSSSSKVAEAFQNCSVFDVVKFKN